MYSAQKDRFDNLENNKNLGQNNVQGPHPDQIITEIDQLEARVRDYKRLLQQERDSELHLSQVKKNKDILIYPNKSIFKF